MFGIVFAWLFFTSWTFGRNDSDDRLSQYVIEGSLEATQDVSAPMLIPETYVFTSVPTVENTAPWHPSSTFTLTPTSTLVPTETPTVTPSATITETPTPTLSLTPTRYVRPTTDIHACASYSNLCRALLAETQQPNQIIIVATAYILSTPVP